MDKISRKVISIVKKRGWSDLEASDIAMHTGCDDDDVETALQSLLEQGHVEKQTGSDGKTYWCAAESPAGTGKLPKELDDDEPADIPGTVLDDEPTVRRNPVTAFIMNLRGSSSKELDDEDLAELPEPRITLGRTHKKVLSLLKKHGGLDIDDISLRLKIDEEEIETALGLLESEGLVDKTSPDGNVALWSAI